MLHVPSHHQSTHGRGVAVIWLVLALAATACAPVRPGNTTAPSRELLTADDLERHGEVFVAKAVHSLRPFWLRARYPFARGPIVMIDGMRWGDITVLNRIPVTGVRTIRFVRGREAQLRWGPDFINGALEIITRPH